MSLTDNAAAQGRPKQGTAPSGGSAAHEMASVGANKTALVMAGGTGGHIFPGLGGPAPSMESQLVPQRGFAYETVDFSGVRGKGRMALVSLPWRLLRACWQSMRVMRRVKPDVVVGLGGYITVPAGMMSAVLGRPLIVHEQNSVAGMANKWLARLAAKAYTAFPDVIDKARWIGNPLRPAFLDRPEPAQRFSARPRPGRGGV